MHGRIEVQSIKLCFRVNKTEASCLCGCVCVLVSICGNICRRESTFQRKNDAAKKRAFVFVANGKEIENERMAK